MAGVAAVGRGRMRAGFRPSRGCRCRMTAYICARANDLGVVDGDGRFHPARTRRVACIAHRGGGNMRRRLEGLDVVRVAADVALHATARAWYDLRVIHSIYSDLPVSSRFMTRAAQVAAGDVACRFCLCAGAVVTTFTTTNGLRVVNA